MQSIFDIPSKGQPLQYGGEDFDNIINDISNAQGVDPKLIRAIVQTESSFNPNATNPESSASGLMQLVKETASDMGVKNVFDPRENITGGVKYFKQQLDTAGGDVDKALAMYNQGPGGDLSKAQDYVGKVRSIYGGQPTAQPQDIDMSSLIDTYGQSPYPEGKVYEKPPLLLTQLIDPAKKGFSDAASTPLPDTTGKLPFGFENTGGPIARWSKDVLYGLGEFGMQLGASIIGLPAAAIGGTAKAITSGPEAGGETFNQIAHAAIGDSQTTTAKVLMRPFEVVFGGILNTGAEYIKASYPNATPEELDHKIKATQFFMNVAMIAPMFKGAFKGSRGIDPNNPAKALASQEITAEGAAKAKAQILSDPNVAPEVKVEVEGIDVGVLNEIKDRAAKKVASDRVKDAPIPEAKFAGNQSIVEGLLIEAELRDDANGKGSIRKAAKIVADLEQDAGLVDFNPIKGIRVKGTTGKLIVKLVAERDAANAKEALPDNGMFAPPLGVKGEAPAKTFTDISIDTDKGPLDLRISRNPDGSIIIIDSTGAVIELKPGALVDQSTLFENGKKVSDLTDAELAAYQFEPILSDAAYYKVKGEEPPKSIEDIPPKGEASSEVPVVESQPVGGTPIEEANAPVISEFNDIKMAKGEGYTFPTKKTFPTLEAAQAKATEMGDGHEVIKVGEKYRVAKYIDEPVVAEFKSVAEANAAGFDVMSEIPERRLKYYEVGEGGTEPIKIGDKYYRTVEFAEMPETFEVMAEEPTSKRVETWEDDVSPAEWAALEAEVGKATLDEIKAQDRIKALSGELEVEAKAAEEIGVKAPADPARVAQLQKAYKEWQDSYVTKCNIAQTPKKDAPPKTPITKEALALAKDDFKSFESEQAATDWMMANDTYGKLVENPETGRWSIANAEKFKNLDELDMFDEGVEQLTGRSESLLDGDAYPDMDMSDTGVRDLFDIFNNERGSVSTDVASGPLKHIIDKFGDRVVELGGVPDAIVGIRKSLTAMRARNTESSRLNSVIKDATEKAERYDTGYSADEVMQSLLGVFSDHTAKEKPVTSKDIEILNGYKKGSYEEAIKLSNSDLTPKDVGRMEYTPDQIVKTLNWPDEDGLSKANKHKVEELKGHSKYIPLLGRKLVLDIVDPYTKDTLYNKGDVVSRDMLYDLYNRAIKPNTVKVAVGDKVVIDIGSRLKYNPLGNERGSADLTPLRGVVDMVESTLRAAEKMGKSIDEYLAHIGADEAAAMAFKSAMARVPQMKQELMDKDPVTTSILTPEGKVVAQTIVKNANKEVIAVGPPITEALANRAMSANRDMQWGSDVVRKDSTTGKILVEHTSNGFEKAMQATEVKINSFRSAGLSDLYSMWREAKSAAHRETVEVKAWIDNLESQIAPERRRDFAIAAYANMKSVKEAFDIMGITEIPTLTPKERMVLEQLLEYTRKFRDRSNYIRTHTGQKAIPKLLDMDGKENYLPLVRDLNVLRDMGLAEGLTISDAKKLGELSKKFNGMFNPNSKKRHVSDIPIELDPFQALRRHAEYGLEEIHISPVAALAKDLANLNLPRIDGGKGKISLVDWNPYLSRMLSRWSDQIVGKDIVATALANANPFFAWGKNRLTKNLVVATIGWSVRTILVQPTSYMIGIPTMLDLRSAGYGIFKLMSERPFGKSNARQTSSILSIREADYNFKELSDYIQQGKMSGTIGYAAQKSLKQMKWVDSIMAEAGWNAARYYGEKRLKLQGKELYRFADDVVERTQGMGIKGAVSDIQSSAATKWLTLLQTFAIADFNLIARDVLGIKNPEANQGKTIIRVAKYAAATILAGQFYKMIGLDNVVPDPIGAYQQAKEESKGDLRAVGAAAGELLEKIPIIGGSAKYSSSLFGIAGEWAKTLPDAGEGFAASLDWGKLTDKQKSYNIRLIARAVGLTAGIPMTNQILKSINSAYKGGNPYQIILGVYDEEKKKKEGLRPEIPRPPRPPKPF